MSEKVFVSPGVYTSEKDLTFVTRQIGVTTLGLVGETTKGPAFQPVFISNYDEFMSFFGGLDNTIIKENNSPKYELPYIAKSYLSQSNQLFVTRVLGFSGYDAGQAWGLLIDAALDESTVVETISATNVSNLISYTATTGGSIVTLVSVNPVIQELIDLEILTGDLAFLATANISDTATIGNTYYKDGGTFTGVSFTLHVTHKGSSGDYVTGSTSGVTTHYSGQPYADAENQLVALLRSRGKVDTVSQLHTFEVSSGGNLLITNNQTVNSPLGLFTLSGVSSTQGNFEYVVSLDKTKRDYLPKVVGRGAYDGKTAVFAEEFFDAMLANYISENKVLGIKPSLAVYDNKFSDYFTQYKPAVTPYVVSELRGNKVLRLFRFWTIPDGDSANKLIKISIANIRPDDREFDVYIRSYYDTDASPVILESFARCTLDQKSNNYIGRKIGTHDGTYASKSSYVLVELDNESDISDAFPSGFVGFPIRDYTENSNTTVKPPAVLYNTEYTPFENKRKKYLGLSNSTGIDGDFFTFKGVPTQSALDEWTGLTKGFHLDVDADTATIDNVTVVINSSGDTYSPVFEFETGVSEFRTDDGLVGGPYEKIFARKFTFAPFGGFDGWDIYRTRRSNLDSFTINGSRGSAGLVSGTFSNMALTNGDQGITSDYYAFLEGIWTFRNPEAININVLATPGIDTFDNTNLVEATIDMVETERADALYIVTTPDTDSANDVLSVEDVAGNLDGMFDSNYTATYWPWVQINDSENNVYIYVPPTRDVVRNIALTDNIAFPWYSVAGIQRGDVNCIKARKKLTEAERNILYENRINPITTFTTDGVKIWGNNTLQVKETALNKVNVRRLLLQARKLISAVSIRLIFDQNDNAIRSQFERLVNPILEGIRKERGLYDFRISVDYSPEDMDRNTLTGKIFLKPTRSLEYIEIQFNIMNTGASFENI